MNNAPFERLAGLSTGRIRWIVPPIYAGCALAFVADMVHDNTISFGLFYIPLICTAGFHRRRSSAWRLAAIASALTVAGMFFPELSESLTHTIVNRAMSIVVILMTAAIMSHMREIQDRLAEQTEQTKELERTKSEVFTNLGQELRVPLHSIIGVSGLMMLDCRADQKPPLLRVQNGSRRLLSTIENLLDLTRLNELKFRSEPIALDKIVGQSIEAAQPAAEERRVAIDTERAIPNGATVCADAWAVRRILDNIIDNAIKFSGAGGTVTIASAIGPGTVSIAVTDHGIGMPPDVVRQLGQPFFQSGAGPTVGTGTGLALCRRLATAIGAELTFESEPGKGTTAVLRLAAADQTSR